MTEPIRFTPTAPHPATRAAATAQPAEVPGRWRGGARAESAGPVRLSKPGEPIEPALAPARLVIHRAGRLIVVRLEEVDWIEGAGNYVRVHARGDNLLHRQTLATLAARLDRRQFARIHRSAIVRLDAITQIETRGTGGGEVELRNGSRLAISRRYRRELLQRLEAQ